MTDYPDFGTPAQNAQQIALAGVPLLTGSKNAAATGATNVPANSTINLGTFQLGQIGYEVFVAVTVDAASTQPCLGVVLNWFDTTGNFQVWQDKWVLGGASAAGGQQYMGTGPTKGNQVQVSVINLDPAKAASITYTMLQNSRVYTRDDWRQLTYRVVPNFINGDVDPECGWLMQANPTVNAGVTTARIMPLFAGQVRLYATASIPFDLQVTSLNPSLGLAPNTFTVFEDKVTAAGGGFVSDTLVLPRTTCLVFFTNNGGTNQVIAVNVVIAEVLE